MRNCGINGCTVVEKNVSVPERFFDNHYNCWRKVYLFKSFNRKKARFDLNRAFWFLDITPIELKTNWALSVIRYLLIV